MYNLSDYNFLLNLYDISIKYKVVFKNKLFYLYLLRSKIDIFIINYD